MLLSDEHKLAIFTEAFMTGGSASATCGCGTTFFDSTRPGDFEENEFELLSTSAEAVALHGSATIIEFEGRALVAECDCWQQRGLQIMAFIDGHDRAIAAYLNARREAALAAADRLPEVASA